MMELRYNIKANSLLLKEQLIKAFGEGFILGTQYHEGEVQYTLSGYGNANEDGNLTHRFESWKEQESYVVVYVNRAVITDDERRRIDEIVAAHNPDEQSQVEQQSEELRADRQKLLARRFSPESPPTMQELIAHVNALTELVEEGALL